MPKTRVVLFREKEGRVPFLEWLEAIPERPRIKCIAKVARLRELGHEMRRPEADYLRDGIYELRIRYQSVNYRVLYFFQGNKAVVVSHGIVKEAAVAAAEITKALQRKWLFDANPGHHTKDWQ